MKTNKNSIKKLVYKIEEFLKKQVRNMGYCEICGSCGQLHAHHIEGKSTYYLRILKDNMICLCAKCHKLGQISAHSDSLSGQLEFHKKLIDIKGKKLLNKLKKLRHKNIELTREELEEMYIKLKKGKTEI